MDGIEDEGVGLDLYEMAEVVLGMGISQAVVWEPDTARA